MRKKTFVLASPASCPKTKPRHHATATSPWTATIRRRPRIRINSNPEAGNESRFFRKWFVPFHRPQEVLPHFSPLKVLWFVRWGELHQRHRLRPRVRASDREGYLVRLSPLLAHQCHRGKTSFGQSHSFRYISEGTVESSYRELLPKFLYRSLKSTHTCIRGGVNDRYQFFPHK